MLRGAKLLRILVSSPSTAFMFPLLATTFSRVPHTLCIAEESHASAWLIKVALRLKSSATSKSLVSFVNLVKCCASYIGLPASGEPLHGFFRLKSAIANKAAGVVGSVVI